MTEPLDLQPIRDREAAATGGPWHDDPQMGPDWIGAENHGYWHSIGRLEFGDGEEAEADKAFVLAARTDIPALLAEVDRLTRERDQAVQKLKHVTVQAGVVCHIPQDPPSGESSMTELAEAVRRWARTVRPHIGGN